MTDIPHQWRAYYAKQSELDERGDTTSISWGIEASLNHLLDASAEPTKATQVLNAAARQSRYAQGLLAKYISFDSFRSDGVAAMEARSSLHKIAATLPPATANLLFDAANGDDPAAIAARQGVSVGTINTRLCRARAAVRLLAA